MDNMEILQCVVAILTGLATCIPLVIKLVEFVEKATKEKNWMTLMKLVMELMETAEEMFDSGAAKKEWVMAMVAKSSETVNYDIDMNIVSKMIDDLCAMSKLVNAPEDGECNE